MNSRPLGRGGKFTFVNKFIFTFSFRRFIYLLLTVSSPIIILCMIRRALGDKVAASATRPGLALAKNAARCLAMCDHVKGDSSCDFVSNSE